MKNKLILGITGGSGTGKSTILSYLKKLGFFIIDADIIAREIVMPGKPALLEIKEFFGDDIIGHDGCLLRKKLGDIVFCNKEKLCILNEITHKYVKAQILNILQTEKAEKVAIEAALLFKGNLGPICDYTIAIVADDDIRKSRIMARDNLSPEQANNRISSQESSRYYTDLCDFSVTNNGDVSDVEKQIKKILTDIGVLNEKS